MNIRFATTADTGGCLAVYAEYMDTVITFETALPSHEEFAGRIRSYGAVYPWLVAEEDGVILGYAYAHRAQERAAYDWNAELSVYLARRAAGRGLGTKLYGALLALLQKQGVRNVYGIVTLPNPASEALHRAFGFRTVGESAAQDSEASLSDALRLSQADEFVSRYPEGAAHPIAQLGRNVSGGQKQRLSIARALARKPEILVFDDSFSALDYRTDAALREGLARELPDTTKIIVAQRISTIRHADQILVLDRGELVGHGTHDELMKTCKVYQEIALSQLSAEELAEGGDLK